MLHSVQSYLAPDIIVIAAHPFSGETAELARRLREATRGGA
jgi:hypothetical protein